MVPAAHIKKMYGKSILVDEINKILNTSLNGYITENKLEVLGNPLPKRDEAQIIDWDNQNSWDQDFLKSVKSLIQLRRTSHALINGGLRWLEIADDYLLFARESKEESLLIFISRSGVDTEIDLEGLGVKLQKTLFGVEQSGPLLRINSTTATQGIWQISS